MSLTKSEPSQVVGTDDNLSVHAMAFTANAEYLVSGGDNVRIWRVRDGKQIARMRVDPGKVTCVAASENGQWIAAGSGQGRVVVWDAATFKQVYAHNMNVSIRDIDFSPDLSSTRLVSANGPNNTATIWGITERRKVCTLAHNVAVGAARYSLAGDRIATATAESIQVWDSNDGRLLVVIKVELKPFRNLLWFNHVLVKTKGNKIKQIDASTGSTVSEWLVPSGDDASCIAMGRYGEFIAYVTMDKITFWSTSTHAQLGLIPQGRKNCSAAFSPDGQLFAIGGGGTKFLIKKLSIIADLEIRIDSAALDSWKNDQLTNAEELLTTAIQTSENTIHVLAGRSIIRTRLQQWDEALVDAEESIRIQPSVIGCIAKSVALVGKGVFDVALQPFYEDHTTLFDFIRAVALFIAGERDNAMSRIDDLIRTVDLNSALYAVQAYMFFLMGNSRTENSDHNGAIQSFEHAQVILGDHANQPPLIISLISGWKFDGLAFTIQQHLCEALLAAGRAAQGGKLVQSMIDQEMETTESTRMWVGDFRFRCRGKLEELGDTARKAKQFDEAISHYTVALLLDPPTPKDLLTKRSTVLMQKGDWEGLLNDANKIIQIDRSSLLGHEKKHAALHGMGRYDDAADTFEAILLKMAESSDPEARERSRNYVRPEQTRESIRRTVKNAIRESPSVLICVISGRLCDKAEQAAAFESLPIFTELALSMTTHIDHVRIEQVVRKFYRYATFSHTWQSDEPLYGKVSKITVYDLERSPAHNKLQMFCKIIREMGINWAWSDTCCIDKGDHFVLQEALISMFKWYQNSAMTIIFLLGVHRLAVFGAMMRSIWNTRGWTLQEYHASEVVRFYTEDWTPYLGLEIYNHKDSPEIISEMEAATGISAQALTALRPGLDNIREKLRLASSRQTTRVEDAAYSLLGLFSVTLPVTYGEGDKSLGRLLSQLLSSSGDTSVLAWTGRSGSFNSCLPANISVFHLPPTSYIPSADAQMGTFATGLRSLNLTSATKLYDQVNRLPVPSFSGSRIKLPCLAFKLDQVQAAQNGAGRMFRAQTAALGIIEIRAEEDLSLLDTLCLVHPWVDFLLDRRTVGIAPEDSSRPGELPSFPGSSSTHPTTKQSRIAQLISRLRQPLGRRTSQNIASLPPLTGSPTEKQRRVFELIARLQRPFGALLLARTRQNVEEYRRVAAESLITVRIQEVTPAVLDRLIDNVQVLDVL